MNEVDKQVFLKIWSEVDKKDYSAQIEKIENWKTTRWDKYKYKDVDKLELKDFYNLKSISEENFVYQIVTAGILGGIRLPLISQIFPSLNRKANGSDLKNMYKIEYGEKYSNSDKKDKAPTIIEKKDQEAALENIKKDFETIKTVFKTDFTKPSELDKAEKTENFSAKVLFRRYIVMKNYFDGKYDYLAIFDLPVINRLAEKFEVSTEIEDDSKKENGYFTLNKAIFDKVKTILTEAGKFNEEENPANIFMNKLTDALWKLDIYKELDFPTQKNPNVIFYGAPGTGKTYEVMEYMKLLKETGTIEYKYVQFHSSYTYEDFIEGVKPVGITKDGNLKLELLNGHFKQFCIDAKNDPEKRYYFVIDEINRANLSSVFGEILTCIEANYRDDPNGERNLIETQYSQMETQLVANGIKPEDTAYYYDFEAKGLPKTCKFGVPANVFIIGMMNDVDKSIDTFDLALRRRFRWIRKDCDYAVIRQHFNPKETNAPDSEALQEYIESCMRLNYYISGVIPKEDDEDIDKTIFKDIKNPLNLGKSYEFGHSFFMNNIEKITDRQRKNLFDEYLRSTLKEYLRSLYEESQLDSKLDEARKIFTE